MKHPLRRSHDVGLRWEYPEHRSRERIRPGPEKPCLSSGSEPMPLTRSAKRLMAAGPITAHACIPLGCLAARMVLRATDSVRFSLQQAFCRGARIEKSASISALTDRAVHAEVESLDPNIRSSGRSATWPGRSVRSRSPRPRRRHRRRRNGRKRPRAASRPRPMRLCVAGQVVQPAVHWAICGGSDGTRFELAGPTPPAHHKQQRVRASPPPGRS